MIIEVENEQLTRELGKKFGTILKGGEIIELIGDVGAGKTTFTKGLALGLGVTEDVQSPSFTISRIYEARDGLTLAHYDFYRLSDAGIMKDELVETMQEPHTVTVIEWAAIIEGVLPVERITISFVAPTDISRQLTVTGSQKVLARL